MRVSAREEEVGLDIVEHDESVSIAVQIARTVDVEGDSRCVRVMNMGLRRQALNDVVVDSQESG